MKRPAFAKRRAVESLRVVLIDCVGKSWATDEIKIRWPLPLHANYSKSYIAHVRPHLVS